MKLKLTKDQVINQFIKMHGDKYLYDKVVYVNTITKILIGCKIHGYFEQSPDGHKRGNGCPNCSHNKLNTQCNIIDDFIKKHGDKYIYDKVIYINNKTKVLIGCKIHGYFEQSPNHHKTGKGCPSCVKLTQDKVIVDFIKKHGNTYLYDKVCYKKDSIKIQIGCKTHGYFEQTPNAHKQGAGCHRCIFKNETKCIEILEFLTNHSFKKSRPKFLNGLELDGYNDKLKCGIEYNGTQHYKFNYFFHEKNEKNFEFQKKRDKVKKKLCKDNGIYLIIVPYYIKDMYVFIKNEYENYDFLRSFQSF